MCSKYCAMTGDAKQFAAQVMLGGGHINADMQQFLENDKKVAVAVAETP